LAFLTLNIAPTEQKTNQIIISTNIWLLPELLFLRNTLVGTQ